MKPIVKKVWICSHWTRREIAEYDLRLNICESPYKLKNISCRCSRDNWTCRPITIRIEDGHGGEDGKTKEENL